VKGKLILSVIDNIYKMDGIIKEALKDLKIGESKIEFEGLCSSYVFPVAESDKCKLG
jgi:hypothetical protein